MTFVKQMTLQVSSNSTNNSQLSFLPYMPTPLPLYKLMIYRLYSLSIILKLVMNHPSDYMNNFEDSLSSDSSNPTIKISQCHKNRPSLSLHQPQPQPPTRSHPHKKSTKHKKTSKKQKLLPPKQEKQRSVSDYLILGDSYYNSKNVREITRRFIAEQQKVAPKVMKMERLKRKEDKSIAKIETYIQTFAQSLRINQLIRTLPRAEKVELYQLLKKEQQAENDQDETIDYYFQCAVQKLQLISNEYAENYPHKNRAITKWKNQKMHQLSTAKTFLSYEAEGEKNCSLESELEILEEEKFFPEMKEDVEELRSGILNHLKYQQQREITVEDSGVKWVLSRLLKFILQNQDTLTSLVNRIQEIQECNYQLLDDNLFILFERDVIGSSENEEEAEELRFIHMFNKSVFDLVNQAIPTLLPRCEANSVEEILREIFAVVPKFEKDEIQDTEILLKIDDIVFDMLLEQALWDFLEYL